MAVLTSETATAAAQEQGAPAAVKMLVHTRSEC